MGEDAVDIKQQRSTHKLNLECFEDFSFSMVEWDILQIENLINDRLTTIIPRNETTPQMLYEGMIYNLVAPGKRLRPILTILTSLHFGSDGIAALDVACAIEMIHTASLILDDLPAMDNSIARRGQPTTHRKFGEDIAILSGVGLLNYAFSVIAGNDRIPADTRVSLIKLLTNTVGAEGLIGGQVMDLHLRSETTNSYELRKLNEKKTAALFIASAEAGALIAGIEAEMLSAVRKFALEVGAAFQLADDLLDDSIYAGQTGKDTSKDANKPTIQSRVGKLDANFMINSHLNAAKAQLELMGIDNKRLSLFIEHGFSKFITK
jgi:geranylgeranyl diphosphate synthase, type II